MRTTKPTPIRRGRCCIGLFVFVTLLLPGLPAPVQADACSDDLTCGYNSCRSPAFGTPVVGAHLLPVGNTSSGQLPAPRDTTNWHEGLKDAFTLVYPQWLSLDATNGWIFTASRFGFEIWDATDGKAASPQRTAGLGRTGFPVWPTDSHEFWPVQDVAVPPGNDAVAAVAVNRGGLAVFSTPTDAGTSTKIDPKAKYGDNNKSVVGVYAARIGGADYVFSATQGHGLLAHNLTAAAAISSVPGSCPSLSDACCDNSPSEIACPGVYVGRLGQKSQFQYLGGAANADGSRHWVVGSTAGALQGLEIWEVSSPGSPQLRLSGLSSTLLQGVALWRNGSQYFLAARFANNGEARIYDVSCISTGGSCSLGSPVWTRTLAKNGGGFSATHSQSGGRHFVYFGTIHTCTTTPAPQSEWLFDVTSASSPFEMTEVAGVPSGYWTWYYRNTATGFNGVVPRRGKVVGNYFYRAATQVFDVHQLVNANPTITVTGPATGYTGESLGFTATPSGGCSPTANGWSWSASHGGEIQGSETSSTANFKWTSPGNNRTVSASNTGCPGAQQVPASTNILDSTPAVGSVSASPNSVFECQPVTLTANGVTGQPDLTFSWEVKQGSDPPVASGSGIDLNPFVWNVPQDTTPGTYTAEVIVTNENASDPKSTTVEVKPLLPLPTSFTPLCTNCDAGSPPSPPFGTVHLSANAPGATEWNWDFGSGPTGWTSNPITGPSPSHTYATTGLKTIRVQVRNCKGGPVTSGDLVVEIEQVSPLVAGFLPQCGGFGCHLSTGQTLTFQDQTQGCDSVSCTWRYAYTNTSATACSGYGSPQGAPSGNPPSTSFTYASAGTFYPCVEVTRGSEEAEFRYLSGVTVSNVAPPSPPPSPPSPPPSPPSPPPPAPPPGSGSTCGAQGQGGLRACFSFSPTSPQPGQGVSFNAGGSGGSPTGYGWKFGDGSPDGAGAQTQHPYGAPGGYQVTLTVTKPGDTCPFGFCSASHTRTVTVSGAAGLQANFSTDASCFSLLCTVDAGQEVAFEDTSTGEVTKRTWDFGDGRTTSGKTPKHTWNQPGAFEVKLTVENGQSSATTSRTFTVLGDPVASLRAVVLPWISQADADKALPQSSDLNVHNPGDQPLKVRITFRKRGVPEPDPPSVERTIAPGATFHVPDAMRELFNRPNHSGFVFVEPLEGGAQPVVSSTNRTFLPDGRSFGQVVPGFPVHDLPAAQAGGSRVHHLVGLNDNADRLAYFGISNPSDRPLSYHLRFFDSLGQPIGGTTEAETVARLGQKQYQIENLRERFGVGDHDDFRIEIEPTEGSPHPFVYGANLRLASRDPSFLQVGRIDAADVYLVGVLNSPGLFGVLLQSDAVLGNVSNAAADCDLTFTPVGPQSEPTAPLTERLPAGESLRLEDVVARWNVGSTSGVLRVTCHNPLGVFPVVQGESYDVSRPDELYGQFMPALTEADAAVPGRPHALAGLAQDADHRTTLWLFNPGPGAAEYSLRYFDLDGKLLGAETGLRWGAGNFRQINPSHHPFGIEDGPGGFVVRVEVTKGKLLTAAQVVNAANDPAYIVGQ